MGSAHYFSLLFPSFFLFIFIFIFIIFQQYKAINNKQILSHSLLKIKAFLKFIIAF